MINSSTLAKQLSTKVRQILAASTNEAVLRHNLEKVLEEACLAGKIPWSSFRLDLTLETADPRRKRFVDVAHGAVIIEYEPPNSLRGKGAVVQHARHQAEEYAQLLAAEEGREPSSYILIIWDGADISFGKISDIGEARWSTLERFAEAQAAKLLDALRRDGTPLVHPLLLAELAGPQSTCGSQIIPLFFRAVTDAEGTEKTTKTKLLYIEWRRLFGQVVGVQSDGLKQLIKEQSTFHSQKYDSNVPAYLFALNTFIALTAKLVAALALKDISEDIRDTSSRIEERLRILESGQLFLNAGALNMLSGDFFAWYLDDATWKDLAQPIEMLIAALSNIDFDVTKKRPESTRDLFKGLYESFVPRALRHALGEYYTPDWLASHVVSEAGWQPKESLTDPTCGTGTFLLEALRRRLAEASKTATAGELLAGINGIDLNPLAVLAARASLVVFLAPRFDRASPVRLPVYLADAINPAELHGEEYIHTLHTERGPFQFRIPKRIVDDDEFFEIFSYLREAVDGGAEASTIYEGIKRFDVVAILEGNQAEALNDSIATLVRLHEAGWNGIWASILADRFAASAIMPATYVCGNPPWVKWSHLPRDYAGYIKNRCLDLGVFSEDRWVGGIESDISTVVTYMAGKHWLSSGGVLAFLITGTVFSNESSQGFRRFELPNGRLKFRVISVEDFAEIKPFDGVSNHPTLLLLKSGSATKYPVRYKRWLPGSKAELEQRGLNAAAALSDESSTTELAAPVPGTDAGPWLIGTARQHQRWSRIFGRPEHKYEARKGVTTDANGIFFVKVLNGNSKLCSIQNDPELGRRDDIPKTSAIVESEHIFPLLRGRGVEAFKAQIDPEYRILVPQRGMHGDPNLRERAPRVFRFLDRFQHTLRARSSYKRFQKAQPWWSLWSTGPYSFDAYKVAWREMGGGAFAAAAVGPTSLPLLGDRIVILDHKLYFVSCESEAESHFLVGILNAPTVSEAVSAYASRLSLGISIMEYLRIPHFDRTVRSHVEISAQAKMISQQAETVSPSQLRLLDRMVLPIFEIELRK